jgi:hypothetical protein
MAALYRRFVREQLPLGRIRIEFPCEFRGALRGSEQNAEMAVAEAIGRSHRHLEAELTIGMGV